jgi:methionyl aminopeptidase
MDPPVPNLGEPGQGPVLEEGMALAVEPLLVLGGPDTVLLDDGWTVVSADGTPSAHFEHTVAITADGPWVLTAPDGGRDWFSRLAQAAAGPAGSGLADSAARPQA